jgi:hypothetical protein
MSRDPQAMMGARGAPQMAQIAKALDPQVMAKIGGLDGLKGLMRQMGTMPGMKGMM